MGSIVYKEFVKKANRCRFAILGVLQIGKNWKNNEASGVGQSGEERSSAATVFSVSSSLGFPNAFSLACLKQLREKHVNDECQAHRDANCAEGVAHNAHRPVIFFVKRRNHDSSHTSWSKCIVTRYNIQCVSLIRTSKGAMTIGFGNVRISVVCQPETDCSGRSANVND
jgi:hypothetical protein